MDPTCLPHKFLTTWVSHPRRSGGLSTTHYETHTSRHFSILKHRRDSKKWDFSFIESPPTHGLAGTWWLNVAELLSYTY
jgi:hypothetical protein